MKHQQSKPRATQRINRPIASAAQEPTPTAPLSAPIAEAPDETPTLAIDPASFRGAYPGKTTRADIDSEWGPGQAIPRDDGTECFFWEIEPFERVAVTFRDGTVTAIQIKLAKPVPSSELAKQLEIADLRTVALLDDDGSAIGQVFPERGVMFSLETGTTSATAVLLESLDPDSFVLRAEGEMKSSALMLSQTWNMRLRLIQLTYVPTVCYSHSCATKADGRRLSS